MNQIFQTLPTLHRKHYVHRTPGWFVIIWRIFFGIFVAVLSYLSFQDWNRMPLGGHLLVAVLIPGLLFGALNTRMWKVVKFIADERGIYFPCNELVATTLGRKQKNPGKWLLVPWHNISNLRVATETDYEDSVSTCVAFDVKVTPGEQEEFFKHIGSPNDCPAKQGDFFPAAYGDTPPSPENTVKLLQDMSHR